MTALLAILKAVAVPALTAGVIAGLLAAWYALSAEQFLWFLVCCGAALLVVFTAVILSAGFPFRRDSDEDTDKAADEHMEPLRRPGTAEKKLATDLESRRMLLQHGGITKARADRLARKVIRRTVRDRIGREAPQRGRHAAPPRAPKALAVPRDVAQAETETLPAIPAMPASLPSAEAHTATEPVPVRLAAAANPDAAFGDWDTGQFERDILLLGKDHAGGAA